VGDVGELSAIQPPNAQQQEYTSYDQAELALCS